MKKLVLLFVLVLGAFVNQSMAQEVTTVKFEQTEGEFNIKGLTLEAGDYTFELSNNGVDHAVGLVIAPFGKTDQANHIKEGYVKEAVENGKTSTTGVVTLTKGEYVYFCPLNPTPEYKITVK